MKITDFLKENVHALKKKCICKLEKCTSMFTL